MIDIPARTFMDRYIAGEIPEDDFEIPLLDAVDDWHRQEVIDEGDITPLHAYLGMTEPEYWRWIHSDEVVKEIKKERLAANESI